MQHRFPVFPRVGCPPFLSLFVFFRGLCVDTLLCKPTPVSLFYINVSSRHHGHCSRGNDPKTSCTISSSVRLFKLVYVSLVLLVSRGYGSKTVRSIADFISLSVCVCVFKYIRLPTFCCRCGYWSNRELHIATQTGGPNDMIQSAKACVWYRVNAFRISALVRSL